MKKTVLFGLFVILQTFVFMGCEKENSNSALYAQSANDAQRIVGNWKTEGEEVIFTFNANGTFSFSGLKVYEDSITEGNYMIINSKLILRSSGQRRALEPRDYYLSSDGKILIFVYSYIFYTTPDKNYWSNVTDFLWLIKQ